MDSEMDPKLLDLSKTCDHCRGAGKLNAGAGKPQFPVLDWLGLWEETCNQCGGTGKIPCLPK